MTRWTFIDRDGHIHHSRSCAMMLKKLDALNLVYDGEDVILFDFDSGETVAEVKKIGGVWHRIVNGHWRSYVPENHVRGKKKGALNCERMG